MKVFLSILVTVIGICRYPSHAFTTQQLVILRQQQQQTLIESRRSNTYVLETNINCLFEDTRRILRKPSHFVGISNIGKVRSDPWQLQSIDNAKSVYSLTENKNDPPHHDNNLNQRRRQLLSVPFIALLATISDIKPSHARGLVQFPCKNGLANTYNLLRVGQTILEEEGMQFYTLLVFMFLIINLYTIYKLLYICCCLNFTQT
jgi:hypothetical protein